MKGQRLVADSCFLQFGLIPGLSFSLYVLCPSGGEVPHLIGKCKRHKLACPAHSSFFLGRVSCPQRAHFMFWFCNLQLGMKFAQLWVQSSGLLCTYNERITFTIYYFYWIWSQPMPLDIDVFKNR